MKLVVTTATQELRYSLDGGETWSVLIRRHGAQHVLELPGIKKKDLLLQQDPEFSSDMTVEWKD